MTYSYWSITPPKEKLINYFQISLVKEAFRYSGMKIAPNSMVSVSYYIGKEKKKKRIQGGVEEIYESENPESASKPVLETDFQVPCGG